MLDLFTSSVLDHFGRHCCTETLANYVQPTRKCHFASRSATTHPIFKLRNKIDGHSRKSSGRFQIIPESYSYNPKSSEQPPDCSYESLALEVFISLPSITALQEDATLVDQFMKDRIQVLRLCCHCARGAGEKEASISTYEPTYLF